MNLKGVVGAVLAISFASLAMIGTARANEESVIRAVNDYFNSITTMHGQFRQVAPDGDVQDGRYWIKRPGRLRLEYEEQVPGLYISDGIAIAELESECDKTVDRMYLSEYFGDFLGKNPLSFLLEEEVDLAKELEIDNVEETEDQLRMTLRTPGDESLGSVTMVFAKDPIKLKQWTVTDAMDLRTTFALLSLETNLSIDNGLFVIPEGCDTKRK